MSHIYHYCAMCQIESGSNVYYDGILSCEDKIGNFDTYKKLKKVIAEDRDNLIITSLGYLGED